VTNKTTAPASVSVPLMPTPTSIGNKKLNNYGHEWDARVSKKIITNEKQNHPPSITIRIIHFQHPLRKSL
jgi:hypothetical protein